MGTRVLVTMGGVLAAFGAALLLSAPLRVRAAGRATVSQSPGPLVMVQGSVTGVGGDTVEIETPPVYPACRPGTPCPMYIIAGERIAVRLSAATAVDSDDGVPVSRAAIEVGSWLAAAGRFQAEPFTTPVLVGRTLDAVLVGVGRPAGTLYPCGPTKAAACPEGKA